ncbi:GNAT family N-acetyltransferase [Marivivens marinus]|uniref:GNAT family N-acetyltransferase n=1 Tax=Marivivens marinus TaxID=3110173 RepID=UPI003B8497BC
MDDLRTDRLTLRPVSPTDHEALFALMSWPEVARMTGSWPIPADRDFALERCQRIDPARGFVYGLWRGAEMVGQMGILEGEIGYAIAPPHWGQGYATEAAQVLLDRAFATYSWDEVMGGVWLDNPASMRVLQKLGFENRPDTVGFCKARGETLLSRRFALTRARYDSLRIGAA